MHSDKLFSTNIEVRFSDIDALGHVNNAVFLPILRRAANIFPKKCSMFQVCRRYKEDVVSL